MPYRYHSHRGYDGHGYDDYSHGYDSYGHQRYDYDRGSKKSYYDGYSHDHRHNRRRSNDHSYNGHNHDYSYGRDHNHDHSHNTAIDNWNAVFKDYSSEYKNGFYVGPGKKETLTSLVLSALVKTISSKIVDKHSKRRL